jgi:bifunctional enzyme CysN/CysC
MHVRAPAASNSLLRFISCGSVDDGKSTLIGRLLHDAKAIFDDQLSAVITDSARHGTTGEEVDLALLVDGLEAEREQGITIDVAYRYFSTKRRSFIAADTPGHVQYTRNMATAASTAAVAIILIDARKGLLIQTKRHSQICSLLGIRDVILAVNKIDLMDYAEATYRTIVADYLAFAQALGFASVTPIPVSARFGDNVSRRSHAMPWYDGPTLLQTLEDIEPATANADKPFRMAVQWVNRPNLDFRGLAGTISGGSIKVGDEVVAALSGRTSKIDRIVTFDGELKHAEPGDAVTLILTDDIDVGRGEILAHPDNRPDVADQFACTLVWMSEEPLLPGRTYQLMCGTARVNARVTTLKHKIDIGTLTEKPARTLALNEIGVANIATTSPLAFDSYANNQRCGAFIMIDRSSNATVAAGMISFALRRSTNVYRQGHSVGKLMRAVAKNQKPIILWFTGLSGSGKSTIADLVERQLAKAGFHTMLLDGDNLRHGLNKDLGFTSADRVENIRRAGEVAKLMVESGLITICSFISPFESERRLVRELVAEHEFVEIFVDTPLAVCIERDVKGLYRRALAGEIPNFTGVGSPYEQPVSPDIRIDGRDDAIQSADTIVNWYNSILAR